MPKILFIVNSDSFFISHRLPIALSAQKHGFKVSILTGSSGECREIYEHGFDVYELNLRKTSINPINFLKGFLKVLKVMHIVKPDILHLITLKPIIMGGLASKIFKPKVLIASITGLGQVYTDKRFSSFLIKKIIETVYRIAYSDLKNKFFIFQNKYDMKYIKRLLKLSKEKIIMTNGAGVFLDQYKPGTFPTNKPVFLFASRLLNAKGVLEFIKASYFVKEAKFIIAGEYDPNNRDSLDKKILDKAIKDGNVIYSGYIKDISELINKSSVVILPSYYGEGLPKILIEAAACGRPIITTNLPGCQETIVKGESGFFTKAKSYKNLIKKINIFVDNPKIIRTMGSKSRVLAEEKFDINVVIQKHMILYKSFLNEPNKI